MTDKQKSMLEHWKNKEAEGHGKIIQCFMAENELFCEFLITGRKKPIYLGVSQNDYSTTISKTLFDKCKAKTDMKIIEL